MHACTHTHTHAHARTHLLTHTNTTYIRSNWLYVHATTEDRLKANWLSFFTLNQYGSIYHRNFNTCPATRLLCTLMTCIDDWLLYVVLFGSSYCCFSGLNNMIICCMTGIHCSHAPSKITAIPSLVSCIKHYIVYVLKII